MKMGNANSAPTSRPSDGDRMRFQMRREAAILVGDTSCDRELRRSTSETNPEILLDSIDQFIEKHRLDDRFYDPAFLRVVGCSMKLGLVLDQQLTASKYVKDYFTDLKQIGAPSVQGIALLTGVKNNPAMFVIKAPKNPNRDNLLHEYFVAAGGAFSDLQGRPKFIIGTNWLRKVCLNYSQVLGAFRCSSPNVDPLSGQVRDWCNNDNPTSFVNYVVYEKIDGDSMAKMAPIIDATTYVTTIIQLAYALEIGQTYNGFTHYDLHYENVILRPVESSKKTNSSQPPTEAMIPYVMTEELTIYVESAYVPTIIDYGNSHIQTPSPAAERMGAPTEHFGFHDAKYRSFGILPDASRPYFDLYKFLGFSLYEMYSTKNPAFEQVWPLVSFFGIKTREEVVRWLMIGRQNDMLFSLKDAIENLGFCITKVVDGVAPTCMPERAVTMYDFLSYVEITFPQIWKTKIFGVPVAGKKLLQCGAECNTFAEALTHLTEESIESLPGNLGAFNDLKSIMRYRNGLFHRGKYFSDTFPDSAYGSKLMQEVERLDEEIRAIYEVVIPNYTEQIIDWANRVIAAYDAIGFPIAYPEFLSSDPQTAGRELLAMNTYLERMQVFMKTYVEYKENYEAAEDLVFIAHSRLDPRLEEVLNTEVSPRYQAVDNARGQIRGFVERSRDVVPPQYRGLLQDVLVKTL
jgi:hypothetical protein